MSIKLSSLHCLSKIFISILLLSIGVLSVNAQQRKSGRVTGRRAGQQQPKPSIPPDARPVSAADLQTAMEHAKRYWEQVTVECSPGIFYLTEGEGPIGRVVHELRRPEFKVFIRQEYAQLGYIPPADALNGYEWAGFSYLIADTERKSTDGVHWGPYQGGSDLDAQVDDILRKTGNAVPQSKVKIGPIYLTKFKGEWRITTPRYNPGGSVFPSQMFLTFRPFYAPGCSKAPPSNTPAAKKTKSYLPPSSTLKLYRANGLAEIAYPSNWQVKFEQGTDYLQIYPEGGMNSEGKMDYGLHLFRFKQQIRVRNSKSLLGGEILSKILNQFHGSSVLEGLKDEESVYGRRAMSAAVSLSDGYGVIWIFFVESSEGALCLLGKAPSENSDEIKLVWKQASKTLKDVL